MEVGNRQNGAQEGWCSRHLADTIQGPRIYAQERLPAGPTWADVERLFGGLDASRSMDVRDRAILMLFAIYGLRESEVAKLRLDQASRTLPSIAEKHISPHCLRHSCAVHLLRSGVDINTIRAWLGHVSLDTTHIYSEVDLEIKAKALALCDLPNDVATKPWHSDPGLIGFLKSL